MSDTNLPTYLPAADDLGRREAADLSQRVTTSIASGTVRETPTPDVAADRLQAVAQQGQRVSQATRDAARSTTSASASPAGLGAAQHQQLTQQSPKAVL